MVLCQIFILCIITPLVSVYVHTDHNVPEPAGLKLQIRSQSLTLSKAQCYELA